MHSSKMCRWLLAFGVANFFFHINVSANETQKILPTATKTDVEVLRTYVLFHLDNLKKKEALEAIHHFLKSFPDNSEALKLQHLVESSDPQSVINYLQSSSSWTFRLDSQSGYNSNVLLLSDQTLNALSRSETQSLYQTVGAFFQTSFTSSKETFRFTKVLNFRYYFADRANDLGYLGGLALGSYAYQLNPRWQFGIDPGVSYSFLNRNNYDLFNLSPFVSAEGIFQIDDVHSISVKVPYHYQYYPKDSSTGQRGSEIGVELKSRLGFAKNLISIGGEFTELFAKSDEYKARTYRGSLSWVSKWSKMWRTDLRASYRFVDYHNSASGRQDNIFSPTIEVRKQILEAWSAQIQYSFSASISNRSNNEYDRHDVSLGVAYEF